MSGSARRIALAFAWLALLALAGLGIGRTLEVTGDLRRFMPEPRTPAQRLLIDELGEGPGARLLLVGLDGAPAETLAAQSDALRQALQADPRFAHVANGAGLGLDVIPESLRAYRYLLTPTFDAAPLDRAALNEALALRVQDLGSPAASLVEPLLPSDPTLETLVLAESWQPAHQPELRHGVWFDRDGRRALLLVQTRAAGFDPTGQGEAVQALRDAFERVRGTSASTLELGGPGAFSVEIGARTQREASLIGSIDSVVFVLILWLAYRSWRAPLLGALPLASGGLAGLGAVALSSDAVHGITIAFGFTLIGVAQDYPIHLFSHQRPGLPPRDNARALWRTLGTGVASTCIAYLTFFVAGVEGLRQLAVFTIVGLATAALATRFVLPALLDVDGRGAFPDVATMPRVQRLWARAQRWPRIRVVHGLALAAVAVAIAALAPGAFWQNDLSRLTPAPAELLARDARLREQLGAPDVRYVIVVQSASVEAALQTSERLRPALDAAQKRGALGGFDLASRYLPSIATQRARQAQLPTRDALAPMLARAVAASPFQRDAFEPFLEDVERARTATPLTPQALAGTPLAQAIEGLLVERDGGATALVSLTGIQDVAAIEQIATAHGATLLDLKAASESLVAEYRTRVLTALALASVLLALTVWVSLRDARRVLRVLAPMALTTIGILAVLRLAGVELNLFHLVALILAAGLGLDYALFFDHAGDARDEQLRALHAIVVCSLTTLLVFSVLALSSIPVLRAIGGTVALGVLCNFVLALLIVRPAPRALEAAP
ncbi:MMPL family transporter [Cognatilysobacter bugurensis]|uniref:Membrane protein n=1 Tax=Cognatilysobacter bugurensis TaxID=543356 RepID=A0A918T2B8_9GAMM|nr:MMPL family transporter [Lysobacter bugurensis]GHA81991.1 membrane protein [Lysobacter bugurensis]